MVILGGVTHVIVMMCKLEFPAMSGIYFCQKLSTRIDVESMSMFPEQLSIWLCYCVILQGKQIVFSLPLSLSFIAIAIVIVNAFCVT